MCGQIKLIQTTIQIWWPLARNIKTHGGLRIGRRIGLSAPQTTHSSPFPADQGRLRVSTYVLITFQHCSWNSFMKSVKDSWTILLHSVDIQLSISVFLNEPKSFVTFWSSVTPPFTSMRYTTHWFSNSQITLGEIPPSDITGGWVMVSCLTKAIFESDMFWGRELSRHIDLSEDSKEVWFPRLDGAELCSELFSWIDGAEEELFARWCCVRVWGTRVGWHGGWSWAEGCRRRFRGFVGSQDRRYLRNLHFTVLDSFRLTGCQSQETLRQWTRHFTRQDSEDQEEQARLAKASEVITSRY